MKESYNKVRLNSILNAYSYKRTESKFLLSVLLNVSLKKVVSLNNKKSKQRIAA